jgi:hypothetical protein
LPVSIARTLAGTSQKKGTGDQETSRITAAATKIAARMIFWERFMMKA